MNFLRCVERGEPVTSVETVRIGKGGVPMQVSLAVSPVRDAAGAVVAASSITRNITERKGAEAALRTSEARHRAILESALDCVITVDAEGRVLDFNPAAEHTFGYTQAHARGRLLHELIIPEELQGAHLAGMARFRESGETRIVGKRVEMPARRADGQRLLVELALTRIPVAGQTLFTAHLRDITGRRRAEELQHAKEEAERANRAKSEFLSRMSHELRTPLNAILGFSQLLELDDLTDAQHEGVRHIISGGRHLLGLINEVLDIARVESGHVEMSPEAVNVTTLVDETLNLIRPLANERGVHLDPGPFRHGLPPGHELHVSADRQRLTQALLNLLSNAIKYNVPGGGVTLGYTITDERLRLRVTDTGRGIPAHKRARLFTPFDRLGAENRGVEGTGLGLALSKRLMEAMGGSLGVEDEDPAPTPSLPVGEKRPGATFWLELPVVSAPVVALAAGDPDLTLDLTGIEPLPGKRTVLLIEDNLSNVALVTRLTETYPGIRLLSAMQGTLGLDLARQHRPDLILLDLHLPDVPGWEVLGQLRADGNTKDIPVVVISADATDAQFKRLMQSGAHAYLTKPLDVRKFLEVMREVLSGGGAPGTPGPT